MKIITLEEHYLNLDIARASAPLANELSPHFNAAYDHSQGYPNSPSAEVLQDLGEGRLADMDANGIDIQVLSSLGTQQLPSDVAVDLVRASNDLLAKTVAEHPDRFAAFAALPTTAADLAADELERCISELGLVGTMINGRTAGDFLDAPRFDPLLKRAEKLGVPIYLHPSVPPRGITELNYAAGLDDLVSTRFQTSAWGWHLETAVHFLHLILSGTFDKYPTLQFILGHWGEMIPFYLDRLNETLPQQITKLDRTIGEYLRQNMYITPSGMFSQAQLQFCVETIGADRIMYAVDYPFVANDDAVSFLENANLTDDQKENIAHGTAERLLGL